MEDDVQSQPEIETGSGETLEQTATEEVDVREDANTPTEADDRGDLRVPLKEERERRQRLERMTNDPSFILQRARELGLAGENQQEQSQNAPSMDVSRQVQQAIRAEKAFEKYPELKEDPTLLKMAAALVDSGYDPLDAADELFSRIKKEETKARTEAAKEAKQEITEKERAKTVSDTVRTDPETERMAQIRNDMKSFDRSTQEKAFVEWLKIKNSK